MSHESFAQLIQNTDSFRNKTPPWKRCDYMFGNMFVVRATPDQLTEKLCLNVNFQRLLNWYINAHKRVKLTSVLFFWIPAVWIFLACPHHPLTLIMLAWLNHLKQGWCEVQLCWRTRIQMESKTEILACFSNSTDEVRNAGLHGYSFIFDVMCYWGPHSRGPVSALWLRDTKTNQLPSSALALWVHSTSALRASC